MSGPFAGYTGSLKESGTAVPVTGEACSFVSGTDPTKIYQVTSTSRRIWDPTAAITVKDGGSTVAAANYVFDYLFGVVTFTAHSVSGSITVDGSYLPTVTVANVRKHSMKLSRAQLDRTDYDDADGWMHFVQGLASGSVDFELLNKISATLDSEDGGLLTYLTNDRPKVLELGGGGSFWRLWVKPENLQESGDVAGLVVGNMTWRQSANAGVTCSYGS